jgi:plasmid stabilization system protein ParE
VRIRYTRRALRQLFAILDYIERHSPQGAKSVSRRLEQLITILQLQPDIGVATRRYRFRRFVLRPYPYVVLYETTPNALIIHSVRHVSRARREK